MSKIDSFLIIICAMLLVYVGYIIGVTQGEILGNINAKLEDYYKNKTQNKSVTIENA